MHLGGVLMEERKKNVVCQNIGLLTFHCECYDPRKSLSFEGR